MPYLIRVKLESTLENVIVADDNTGLYRYFRTRFAASRFSDKYFSKVPEMAGRWKIIKVWEK
jgi:hypothetical protein